MMIRTVLLSFSLGIAILGGGCKKETPPPVKKGVDPAVEKARAEARAAREAERKQRLTEKRGATEPERPPLLPEKQPDSYVPAGTTFKLLSEGAAPRRLLQHQFAVGTKEQMVATMSLRGYLKRGKKYLLRKPIPKIQWTLDVLGERKTPGGHLMTKWYTPMPNRVRKMMKMSELSRLRNWGVTQRGVTGWIIFTQRGLVSEGNLNQQGITDLRVSMAVPVLTELFLQMTPSLPSKPVGVGARWQVEREVRSRSSLTTSRVRLIYTLQRLSGHTGRLTFELEVIDPKGNLVIGAMPPGSELKLVDSSHTLTGRVDFNLKKRVSPISVVGKVAWTATRTLPGQKPETMSSKLSYMLKITPKR